MSLFDLQIVAFSVAKNEISIVENKACLRIAAPSPLIPQRQILWAVME